MITAVSESQVTLTTHLDAGPPINNGYIELCAIQRFARKVMCETINVEESFCYRRTLSSSDAEIAPL
jgi:hypothetical protein